MQLLSPLSTKPFLITTFLYVNVLIKYCSQMILVIFVNMFYVFNFRADILIVTVGLSFSTVHFQIIWFNFVACRHFLGFMYHIVTYRMLGLESMHHSLMDLVPFQSCTVALVVSTVDTKLEAHDFIHWFKYYMYCVSSDTLPMLQIWLSMYKMWLKLQFSMQASSNNLFEHWIS